MIAETGTPELTNREFQRIREFAYSKFGLDLRDGKERMVSARLGKHLRRGGFRSYSEYLQHVMDDRSGESLVEMINALSTNHTGFFREQRHFDFMLETVVPAFRGRELNVWSAASSTGEEPHSIAIALLECAAASKPARTRIIATDISTSVLQTARRGVYPSDRIVSVPPMLRVRYFHKADGTDGSEWALRPDVKALVQFQRLNLIDPFQWPKLFQLIFCRNVMIYFNRATQADLVRRLAACLEPGGYLFVGHSESLTGIEHPLEYVEPAIYRKPIARRNGVSG